jgi:hypothetical protein
MRTQFALHPEFVTGERLVLAVALKYPNYGRGWVRTSDLSRVKGDEEGVDSGVNPVDKPDSGDGG